MTDVEMINAMCNIQKKLDKALLEKGKALRLTEEEIEHKLHVFFEQKIERYKQRHRKGETL